jgi:hypothetical protein
VAYEMEMTPGSLTHCIRALTQAGWLIRKFRGMGRPEAWILNWEVIGSIPRAPYVSEASARRKLAELEGAHEDELDHEPDDELEGADEEKSEDEPQEKQDVKESTQRQEGLVDELFGKCAFQDAAEQASAPIGGKDHRQAEVGT